MQTIQEDEPVTLSLDVPDVDALKKASGMDFVRVVSNTLSRYDMKTPAFNFAANAKIITPLDKQALFLYPEEAQGVIFSGIKALREFEATGQISQDTREKFIVEETKDLLRNMKTDQQTTEYKDFCERVMGIVARQLTGIGSLALAPIPSSSYSVKSVTYNKTLKIA